MPGLRRFRTYKELVKSLEPTYYWSMQEAIRPGESWRADVGPYMMSLNPSIGVGPTNQAPWDGELATRGGAYECGTNANGSAGSNPGVVNANRNTTGYSFACWARLSATGRNDDAIMGNWLSSAGAMLYLVTANAYRAYHNGSFSTVTGATQDLLWHHWCVTWDGTTQRTYQDGVELFNVARTGALGSATRLSIGYYGYATSTDAAADQCHYGWWENRALTPAEVKLLALK